MPVKNLHLSACWPGGSRGVVLHPLPVTSLAGWSEAGVWKLGSQQHQTSSALGRVQAISPLLLILMSTASEWFSSLSYSLGSRALKLRCAPPKPLASRYCSLFPSDTLSSQRLHLAAFETGGREAGEASPAMTMQDRCREQGTLPPPPDPMHGQLCCWVQLSLQAFPVKDQQDFGLCRRPGLCQDSLLHCGREQPETRCSPVGVVTQH